MSHEESQYVERAVSRTDRRVRESLDYLQGHLSVLRRTGLDAEQRAALQAVEQSTSEILLALEQLGDLVHDSAKEPAQSFRFDLRRSLDWVRRQFQGRAKAHGLSFSVTIHPLVPSLLLGDARRLRSVLVSLLDNALRCTPSGEVRLLVQPVPPHNDQQVAIRFEIIDSGPGVPEHIHQSLSSGENFELTEEAAPSLAITARWLASMGGSLGFSAASPNGAHFWFELAFGSASGAIPSAPRTSVSGKVVLIVDQSLANRRLLEKSIGHVGGHSQSCSSLAEALTFLDSGELPDAIILDGELPGGDRGEAAATLLASSGSTVPVLLLVPVAARGDGARFRELGCRAYLVKPLQQEQILEALSAALAEEPIPSFITTHSLEEAAPLKASVLLLTDDPLLSRQVEHHLSGAGHLLRSVACRKEALDGLPESTSGEAEVALILLDEPGQALDLLPDLHQRWAGVPCVGLVSPNDAGNSKLTAQGVDELLFKPLRAWELSQAIRRWAGRELQRAPLAGSLEQDPPIKIDVLDEATDGDRELQQEMITVFCEDLTSSLKRIEQALEKGELRSVQAEAHSMKGSAPYFGADAFADLARTLESECQRGDATRSLSTFHACREEFQRIRAFFEGYPAS